MDNFKNEDIIMFVDSYKQNILENPLLNSKIPVWVEYLKTKKHYRENGMEEDYFFKKRFGITNDDLITINKLIDRVKRGKTLTKQNKSNVRGSSGITSLSSFSTFDENQQYPENGKNFELLDQVQDAMNSYYIKMKKNSDNKKGWKRNNYKNNPNEQYNSTWDPSGCIESEPDRYYTEDINSHRPQVEFDVQNFAKTEVFNMNKTNIIQKLDDISDKLDYNNLITNDFDTEYKRSVPNLNSKKKVQFCNQVDTSINNNSENKIVDVGAARFWQDQDILNQRGNTRNTCIPNQNPFEHQFQYLDGNYNRVPDPRLLGTSSRLENRSTFNR